MKNENTEEIISPKILADFSSSTVTWRLKVGIVESDRKSISKAKSINRARSRANGLPWDYYTWLAWKLSTRLTGYCGIASVSMDTRA
jgi:hypothetical protein